MTATVGNPQDKARSISILEELISRFILNGVPAEQARLIGEHISWLRRNPNDLNVNCKLETVPELELTRIVVEYSFLPIPPLRAQ